MRRNVDCNEELKVGKECFFKYNSVSQSGKIHSSTQRAIGMCALLGCFFLKLNRIVVTKFGKKKFPFEMEIVTEKKGLF